MKYLLRLVKYFNELLTNLHNMIRSLVTTRILKKVNKNHKVFYEENEEVPSVKTQTLSTQYVNEVLKRTDEIVIDDIAKFYTIGEGKKLVSKTMKKTRFNIPRQQIDKHYRDWAIQIEKDIEKGKIK